MLSQIPLSLAGVSIALLSVVACLIWSALYNVFLHPLRKFPGPRLWAASRVPFARMVFGGKPHKQVLQLHQKYGDVVRVAPDELSFVNPAAWDDIMGHRKRGQEENGKDPIFFHSIKHSVIGAGREDHSRMRRILSHGFSAQSMLNQQALVQSYVDLLIQRLRQNCDNGQRALDLTSWYNWVTFDVIGDLAFGEPFGCLESSQYHPWVSLVFDRARANALNQVLRRFPFGDFLIKIFTTRQLRENFRAHYQLTQEKVAKRLEMQEPRSDFMEIMARSGKQDLSDLELVDNSSILIIAGSETTATTLSAASFFLTTNPPALAKVVAEVRSSFKDESEINLLSVQKLEYMLAVLDEVLRIYPPVPSAIPRVASANGVNVCGQHIPSGTRLGIWQWPLYHNPRAFSMPESFIPERWLGDPRFANDAKEAFQPFSVGPRNCLGKNLAYAEMRLVLAKVLWNFDMSLDASSKDWARKSEVYGLWQKPELKIFLSPK